MYIGGVRTEDLATELMTASARLVRLAGVVVDVPLSTAQTRVLARLRDDGPMRVTDLARKERCSQPSMTSLIDRLEQAGYATRTADPDDGRASYVGITEAGRAQLVAARASMARVLAPHLAGLSDQERGQLRAAARILTTLMEDMDN